MGPELLQALQPFSIQEIIPERVAGNVTLVQLPGIGRRIDWPPPTVIFGEVPLRTTCDEPRTTMLDQDGAFEFLVALLKEW